MGKKLTNNLKKIRTKEYLKLSKGLIGAKEKNKRRLLSFHKYIIRENKEIDKAQIILNKKHANY